MISVYKSLSIFGKKVSFVSKFYNTNDQKLLIYKPNGAIYIFLLKDFKKEKIPIDKLSVFIMSEKESLDINTLKI